MINESNSYSVDRAENYIKAPGISVNEQYRCNYHVIPPVGWINDPNGFCFFQGRYHLFGQYHPYSTEWGPMHWGHWCSDDLLHWEWIGVSLAPDMPYDRDGCFSGTALILDDELIVMYTGVIHDAADREIQQQCIARSKDGIHFEKAAENPVITSAMLPVDADPSNFRDPKLFRHEGEYRAIMASRDSVGGRLIVYRSLDFTHWEYLGVFVSGIGEMPECPDYQVIEGHEVVTTSIVHMPLDGYKYPSDNPSVYMTGKTDPQKGFFVPDQLVALDNGFDYYAPQAVMTPESECILISWLPGWYSAYPLHSLKHGWNGCMSLPRLLRTAQDGTIRQFPLPELSIAGQEVLQWNGIVTGNTEISFPHPASAHIKAKLEIENDDLIWINLFSSRDEHFTLIYNAETSLLTMDRSMCGHDMTSPKRKDTSVSAFVPLLESRLNLDIFTDKCTVELFTQNGTTVMSSMVYPLGKQYQFNISSRKSCKASVTIIDLSELN